MTLPAVQELRALDVFDSIPPGFETEFVDDDRNWPHLRYRETAVFDPGDRQPVHGELFVFEYSHGSRSISSTECHPAGRWLGQTRDGFEWWTMPLNRPRGGETIDDWLRQRRQLYMSDGPMDIDLIARNIIGRVVGVYMGGEAQP